MATTSDPLAFNVEPASTWTNRRQELYGSKGKADTLLGRSFSSFVLSRVLLGFCLSVVQKGGTTRNALKAPLLDETTVSHHRAARGQSILHDGFVDTSLGCGTSVGCHTVTTAGF